MPSGAACSAPFNRAPDPPVIRIPQPLLTSIMEAAEAAYPLECCGLLVGRGEAAGDVLVTRVEPSPNRSEGDRRKSFLVDPKVQFDLMRELDDGPEHIIGNFHSHPDHPARPSDHDLQSVFYPEHVWIIVAVDDGRAGEVAAYSFDEKSERFREIGLAADPTQETPP